MIKKTIVKNVEMWLFYIILYHVLLGRIERGAGCGEVLCLIQRGLDSVIPFPLILYGRGRGGGQSAVFNIRQHSSPFPLFH